PFAALIESSGGRSPKAAASPEPLIATGHSETAAADLFPDCPHAAKGQREPCVNSISPAFTEPDGFWIERASHAATGVLTAFPTSFQRCRSPRGVSSAGRVQSVGNP